MAAIFFLLLPSSLMYSSSEETVSVVVSVVVVESSVITSVSFGLVVKVRLWFLSLIKPRKTYLTLGTTTSDELSTIRTIGTELTELE